jgi:hypothetical protein
MVPVMEVFVRTGTGDDKECSAENMEFVGIAA